MAVYFEECDGENLDRVLRRLKLHRTGYQFGSRDPRSISRRGRDVDPVEGWTVRSCARRCPNIREIEVRTPRDPGRSVEAVGVMQVPGASGVPAPVAMTQAIDRHSLTCHVYSGESWAIHRAGHAGGIPYGPVGDRCGPHQTFWGMVIDAIAASTHGPAGRRPAAYEHRAHRGAGCAGDVAEWRWHVAGASDCGPRPS